MALLENIKKSVGYLKDISDVKPDLGIILGTGLGALTEKVSITHRVPYQDIPHFKSSTVSSHAGELLFASYGGKNLLILSGRLHFYEGHSAQELTYPVRVLKYMGIEHLLISNVAGGTNPDYEAGDFVFIKDHINLQPNHPLRGPNDERIGPRFPDMSKPYDSQGIALCEKIAGELNLTYHTGIYACLQGPSLETPAEYEYVHRIGADLVGMSTVPEVIVARHMDLPVNVISLVSNVCYPPERIKMTTLESVLELVKSREAAFIALVCRFISDHAV